MFWRPRPRALYRATIVSILEQDFPAAQMEIVVVDDGSTDSTSSIIDRHARVSNQSCVAAQKHGCAQKKQKLTTNIIDGADFVRPESLIRRRSPLDLLAHHADMRPQVI
jgi:glycosyltransferase involved in cell wall biosynthesis